MTAFPSSIIPSTRTYSPGAFPHTAHGVYDGSQVRVRHSNTVLGGWLRLFFPAISTAELLTVISHYSGQRGRFLPFAIPNDLLSGVDTPADFTPAGHQWRYAARPTVEDISIAGGTNRHNLTIELETVPPENTIVPGARLRARASLQVGSAQLGIFLSAIASIEAGAAADLGALGVTVTLAAGAAEMPDPLKVTATLTAGTASNLWTPLEITTALWLDADDYSTFTLSSGAVSQWDDKSGNNRDAAQSSSGKRPAYSATGLNSLPSVNFDGSDDALDLPGGFLNGTTAISVAFVLLAPLQNNDAIFGPSGSYSTGLELVCTNVISQPTLARFNNSDRFTSNLWSTNSSPTITVLQADSTDTRGWKDGTTVTAFSSAAISALNFNGTYSLGQYGGTFNAEMNLAEFIITEGTWTTGTRERIEGYLAHKWGLTAGLPSGHPYKTVAP